MLHPSTRCVLQLMGALDSFELSTPPNIRVPHICAHLTLRVSDRFPYIGADLIFVSSLGQDPCGSTRVAHACPLTQQHGRLTSNKLS